jgi:hypothetical protein
LRQAFELIDEQQRMHRGNLESLAARLAHDLIVDANEVVAQLRELRTIAFVRALRHPIFLRSPHPAHRILIRAAAARATKPLVAILVLVEEESAFV